MNNSAIGVFDSGVGGLTCVDELRKLMPNENIVYLGDTARIPYGTKSKDTKFLAHELRTGFAVVEVADGVNKHTHDEFGHSVAVLAGGVHGNDAAGGASLEVEVVVAGAGTDDDLQFFGVVDNFLGDLVGADDESVGIFDSLVEVVHVSVFFEESQGVAILLDHFADAVNGDLCEGFFGSN